jgi:hypothetical protein
MNAGMCAPLFLFGLTALVFAADPEGGKKAEEGKKVGDIEFDMSYLEKSWGIKYKAHTVQQELYRSKVRSMYMKRVSILLEFTKDLDNLTDLRQAFTTYSVDKKPETPVDLWFYAFDKDNVAISKQWPTQVQGDLSGKKGDAFRVLLMVSDDYYPGLRRIAARPGDKKKETNEK